MGVLKSGGDADVAVVGSLSMVGRVRGKAGMLEMGVLF